MVTNERLKYAFSPHSFFVGSCATVQCSEGHVCRMINGSPECICKPRCSSKMKQLGPFCGTDGRKYKNYCSLLCHNCMYQQQVEISYFGKCRSKQIILKWQQMTILLRNIDRVTFAVVAAVLVTGLSNSTGANSRQ